MFQVLIPDIHGCSSGIQDMDEWEWRMSMFDKNISQAKLKSLECAEAAREVEWKAPSFALKLFHGSLDFDLINPFPKEDPEQKKACDAYMVKMEKFLRENLNPDEVDKTGEIPQAVYKGLADLCA